MTDYTTKIRTHKNHVYKYLHIGLIAIHAREKHNQL